MDDGRNPIQRVAAELRDIALDQHEFESALFRGVAAVDVRTARPGLDERLQALILGRAQQNAEFAMRMANLLDELSEAAGIDDEGEAWKRQ